MRPFRRAARVGALLLAGCGHGATSPEPAPLVRFAAADPRRCLPAVDAAPADTLVARACAEAFVRLNGYSPTLASRDTTLLARETFEVGSWPLLREKRRYSIEPKGVLSDCDASGCIVFFRRFVRSLGCLAASMSPDYQRLQFGKPADVELLRRSAQLRCF